jgi:putative ABC transport system permease protein
VIGYGLGVGAASLFGYFSQNSELAFLMPWQLLAVTGVAIMLICVASSLVSIRKVIQLEPAIVFKG